MPPLAAYRQAIAINPQSAAALSNLGNVLKAQGRLDDAIAAYRQAIAAEPSCDRGHRAHSNLVYILHFHPAFDARAIAQEQQRWYHQHAEPLARSIQSHPNDRSPGRRLKIGYVSPDFRDHVIGLNLLPLFQHHDREQFAIYCYSQVNRPDAITARFQRHAETWHPIVSLSDEQVAQRIRDDQIDILVDLTLHMAGNRLLVFARKPAPLQVTFGRLPRQHRLAHHRLPLQRPLPGPAADR